MAEQKLSWQKVAVALPGNQNKQYTRRFAQQYVRICIYVPLIAFVEYQPLLQFRNRRSGSSGSSAHSDPFNASFSFGEYQAETILPTATPVETKANKECACNSTQLWGPAIEIEEYPMPKLSLSLDDGKLSLKVNTSLCRSIC